MGSTWQSMEPRSVWQSMSGSWGGGLSRGEDESDHGGKKHFHLCPGVMMARFTLH